MERLIAVIGPTAVGKTRVSIDLAEKLGTEIISGDSMLVYRRMDIGTAKPNAAERRGIRHHLIDILEPDEDFSVVDFQTQAAQLVAAINAAGRIPVLAGGTGLYVKALLEGYTFNAVESDAEVRSRLAALADRHGSAYLYGLLQQASPEAAAGLHPNDLRRIIRALEIHQLSGEPVSRRRKTDGLSYDALVIGLTMPREMLYRRINQRVDAMVERGLVEEVARLLDAGVPPDAQAMQGIGYKEIALYLRGETDLPETVDRLKQATRNFAKRQLTWYRKMNYIQWVPVDEFPDYEKMLAYIYSLVAGKFSLE
ncbi:MAG TPA: tRNA (adenosine(37)-N6)-dimethylallyltransferase MiaA [Selenomonadales bacterium]|nr:tRNA (adenosine(37)-N6)-dimethylallyltransferase MiaA [Selenomonadales bacterium]